MSQKSLTLDARLGLDKYEIDEEQSHIQVDQERCKGCDLKPCLTVPRLFTSGLMTMSLARYEIAWSVVPVKFHVTMAATKASPGGIRRVVLEFCSDTDDLSRKGAN
jgi:hypothetical protein